MTRAAGFSYRIDFEPHGEKDFSMKRSFPLGKKLAGAAGALALGWLAGPAAAQTLPSVTTAQPPAIQQPAGPPVIPAMPAGQPVNGSGPGGSGPGCGEGHPLADHDHDHDDGEGGGLIFDVGLYWMHPSWQGGNESYRTSTSTFTTGTVTTSTNTTTTHEFTHGTDVAPRIILGYESSDGCGVRVSWWEIDETAHQSVVNTDTTTTITAGSSFTPPFGATDTFALGNHVNLDVWDFDGTQRLLHNESWDLTLGGGLRYLHIGQSDSVAFARTGATFGTTSAFLFAGHSFTGEGLDVLVDATRRLGHGRNLAAYGNARAGAVYGHGHTDSFAKFVGTSFVTNSAQTDRFDDTIPFLEMELGVEWVGSKMGNFTPEARLGGVAQEFFGVGTAQGGNANLGFYGLTFMAGVRF
jgi:hypothetical protein